MAKKKYDANSRSEMERDEKQPVVETGMPKTRFQDRAQLSTGSDNVTKTMNTPVNTGDIVVKSAEAIRDKVKVRPASSSTLASNETVGGVSSDNAGATYRTGVRNAAGAMNASVVDDASKISYVKGGSRPDQRFDRKFADNDFVINNTICEQIEPEFEGTKPIQESGDKKQGYFGRKQFTQARGKKNAGDLPQSTLFDRSIDFVEIDQTLHTTGQVIDSAFTETVDSQGETVIKSQYPTVRCGFKTDADEDGIVPDRVDIPNPMLKTNYVLKSMSVTFQGGKLNSIRFNEDRVDAHAS